MNRHPCPVVCGLLTMVVASACGPAYVDAEGDWDEVEASSDRVWKPISTALGQRDFPAVDEDLEWTAHTRPDFGVVLRIPSEWEVSVHTGEGSSGLSFQKSTDDGVSFIGVVANSANRDIALEKVSQDPKEIDILSTHLLDAGSTVISGMETMYAEWSGAIGDSQVPCHVLQAGYATHSDGRYTLLTLIVMDVAYEELRPSILEMLSTLAPMDPRVVRRPAPHEDLPPAAAAKATWPSLDSALPPSNGASPDAAVIVAIEDYLMAPDVAGARQNADGWYGYLRKTRGIPIDRVRLLRDQEATVEEMRAAIGTARDQTRSEGRIWFVFIGHGAPSGNGKDGLLVGADAQQSARSLDARSLRRSALLAELDHAVVVLDACFSGQTHAGALAKGLQPFLPIGDAVTKPKVILLTAAGGAQFAGQLPGAERPAFSYLVLGALRGWADRDATGTVTASEVFEYTRHAMGVVIKGRVQTPEISGEGSEVLATGVTESGPDLDALVLNGR